MIDLIIYHLHIVGALYAFTMRWQRDGIKGGALAVATCGLVFTILWAVTGPIAYALMPALASSPIFTADTLSLVLLLVPEIVFFRVFFLRTSESAERDPAQNPS
jgi:hypothetical protein